MLILSVIHGFASRQVDYVQAFPQAPIDDDVYIRVPQGFSYNRIQQKLIQVKDNPKYRDNTYCIKLKRNLYGCRQASRNWFLFLSKGLEKHGFKPSNADPCLFLRNDAVICLYTDDCCIFAKDSTTIDHLISDLSDDFLLKDEGSIEDFLGVRMVDRSQGSRYYYRNTDWSH